MFRVAETAGAILVRAARDLCAAFTTRSDNFVVRLGRVGFGLFVAGDFLRADVWFRRDSDAGCAWAHGRAGLICLLVTEHLLLFFGERARLFLFVVHQTSLI